MANPTTPAPAALTLALGVPLVLNVVIAGKAYQFSLAISNKSDGSGVKFSAETTALTADSTQPADSSP